MTAFFLPTSFLLSIPRFLRFLGSAFGFVSRIFFAFVGLTPFDAAPTLILLEKNFLCGHLPSKDFGGKRDPWYTLKLGVAVR